MKHSFFVERIPTPTGLMIAITDAGARLRALDWEDKAERTQRLLRLHYGANGYELQTLSGPSSTRLALEAYFAGDLGALNLIRTQTAGTGFQRQVWAALRAIPVGQTMSYSQLAVRIGRPTAIRAVGAANGANPIAVVVPCHRVVGADASLTGFAGGLDRKRWLLVHESAPRLKHVVLVGASLQG